jgi:hypothetical protein
MGLKRSDGKTKLFELFKCRRLTGNYDKNHQNKFTAMED